MLCCSAMTTNVFLKFWSPASTQVVESALYVFCRHILPLCIAKAAISLWTSGAHASLPTVQRTSANHSYTGPGQSRVVCATCHKLEECQHAADNACTGSDDKVCHKAPPFMPVSAKANANIICAEPRAKPTQTGARSSLKERCRSCSRYPTNRIIRKPIKRTRQNVWSPAALSSGWGKACNLHACGAT